MGLGFLFGFWLGLGKNIGRKNADVASASELSLPLCTLRKDTGVALHLVYGGVSHSDECLGCLIASTT